MSFIEKPLDDVQDPECGPEGLYDLVIEKADDKMDGEIRKNMLVIIKVTRGPAGVNIDELKNILHNLSFILPTDDEEKAKNKQLFFKKFCYLFSVNTKGKMMKDFGPMDFIGKKALKAQLKIKDYQGQKSNIINLPQIPKGK